MPNPNASRRSDKRRSSHFSQTDAGASPPRTSTLTGRVSKALKRRAKAEAGKQGVSVSQLVQRAVRRLLGGPTAF